MGPAPPTSRRSAVGTGRGPYEEDLRRRMGRSVLTGTSRRRARHSEARPRVVVQFSLTDGEFQEVSRAAERSGLARGAFAAEAALRVACGAEPSMPPPLQEALIELMAAAGRYAGLEQT